MTMHKHDVITCDEPGCGNQFVAETHTQSLGDTVRTCVDAGWKPHQHKGTLLVTWTCTQHGAKE